MRTIEQIKADGRFYKAGSIVPERVLSIRPRHKRHLVKFGSDCWVMGVGKGRNMVVVVDSKEPGSAIALRHVEFGITFHGGKYVQGETVFLGGWQLTDDELAESVEKALRQQ